MIKYIIPFYYTYHSRSRGIHFLSYFVMVVLPQLLLCFFYRQETNIFRFLIDFLIAFSGMLSIYESGYIVNDCICIKNDPHPSNRISHQECEYLEKHIVPIFALKTLVSIICVLYFLFFLRVEKSIFYTFSLLFLLLTYIVHNSVRSFVNFVTVFVLTTFNYFSTVSILCLSNQFLICLIVIIMSFSVPKTIFYIRRKILEKNERFGFAFFYLCELVLLFILHVFLKFDVWLLLIPFSQFIWRFLASFLKSKKQISEESK
ncbi:MAG: hypothetical protein PUE30_07500 [Spirochaetia bacterium]|nr:hypothetical protein [Spirochaetia bacterium]